MVYEVIEYFEVITDYKYHLGLYKDDKLYRISENKYRLDGTNHTFNAAEIFIREFSND